MIMILCLVVSFPETDVSHIPIKIDQSAVTLIGATIVFLFEKTEIRLEGHRHVLARRMSSISH